MKHRKYHLSLIVHSCYWNQIYTNVDIAFCWGEDQIPILIRSSLSSKKLERLFGVKDCSYISNWRGANGSPIVYTSRQDGKGGRYRYKYVHKNRVLLRGSSFYDSNVRFLGFVLF